MTSENLLERLKEIGQEDIEKSFFKQFSQHLWLETQLKALKILAKTLTEKKNLMVSFSGGNKPQADIKVSKIILPKVIVDDKFIDWILKKGITLHEIYHILFSGDCQDFISEKKTMYLASNNFFNEELFINILNVIEDARIEVLGAKKYRGSLELLGFVNSFFYNVALYEGKRLKDDILFALAFEIKGYKSFYKNRALLDKILKIAEGVFVADFSETMNIAFEIYKILKTEFDDTELYHLINGLKYPNNFPKREFNQVEKIKKKSTKQEAKEIMEKLKKADDEYKEFFNFKKNKQNDNKKANDIQKFFDKKLIQKITERFSEEKNSFDKIEKQTNQLIEKKTDKILEEFLLLKKIDNRFLLELPEKKENYLLVKEADNVAKMIANELRNKIIIGQTTLTNQLSGKIHLKSAVRNLTKYNVFGEFDEHIYKRDVIETPKHSVILLIDCSGSMSLVKGHRANKSKNRLFFAKKTVYIMAKIFNELGIDFSIKGFGENKIFLIKDFDDEFEECSRLWNLVGMGSTPTAEITELARKKFNDMNDELKIIFTITDGQPNNIENTKNVVENCRKENIQVFGIYFNDFADKRESSLERRYLEFVYGDGNYIICKDYEELKEGLVKLYEKVLVKCSYGFGD